MTWPLPLLKEGGETSTMTIDLWGSPRFSGRTLANSEETPWHRNKVTAPCLLSSVLEPWMAVVSKDQK